MGQSVRSSSQNQLSLSQSGQLASTFQPGQQYVLQMKLATPSLYMVYASAGVLAPLPNQINDVSRPTDGQLANCPNRAQGLLAANTQKSSASFVWTAPNTATQPVMFRLTSATGYGSTPVYTSLTVPIAAATPVTVTPTTPTVPAQTLAPAQTTGPAQQVIGQTTQTVAVASVQPTPQVQPVVPQVQIRQIIPQAQTGVPTQTQAQQPAFQASQATSNAQQGATLAQTQASSNTPAGNVTKPYWRGRYVFQSGGTFRANSPSCPAGATQANCLPTNFFSTGEAYSMVGQICIGPMSTVNPSNPDIEYGRCDITIQAFWRSFFPKWKIDPAQNTACVVTKPKETSQQSIALKPVSICARLVSDCPTTDCKAQLSPFTFCWSMNQIDEYYMAIDNEASGVISTTTMDGVGLKMSSVPCDFET